MCNIRCRKSFHSRCRCSCNGRNHGKDRLSISERQGFLNIRFPPCTPVRFMHPNHGEISGRVQGFVVLSRNLAFVSVFSDEYSAGGCLNIENVKFNLETNNFVEKSKEV